MCKPAKEESTTKETQEQGPQTDPLQTAAIQQIESDPDVELVEITEGKVHLRNVHTKLGVVLPFQDVIDGKYDAVKGDEAKAALIVPPLKSGKLAPEHAHDSNDWGKSPAWLPHYPELSIQPGHVHGPKPDGSVWGQISGTHSDSIADIREFLIKELKNNGLELGNELKKENQATLIFVNFSTDPNDPEAKTPTEKRKAFFTLARRGATTLVTIQYSYGMK